ncbi:MAG: hypothetical protein M5U26_26845 [Planctomycetota bacterium]|nr:hypothetical protein [Planctomycetota bacterium]
MLENRGVKSTTKEEVLVLLLAFAWQFFACWPAYSEGLEFGERDLDEQCMIGGGLCIAVFMITLCRWIYGKQLLASHSRVGEHLYSLFMISNILFSMAFTAISGLVIWSSFRPELDSRNLVHSFLSLYPGIYVVMLGMVALLSTGETIRARLRSK